MMSAALALAAPAPLRIAGVALSVTPEGALWWPERRVLIAADLHLEKGSSWAGRGVLLPPYDTAATLLRLTHLVVRFEPSTLILLGDTFHDRHAAGRLCDGDRDRLLALARGRETVLIAGNHDPEPPADLGPFRCESEVRLGPLVFRHEPGGEGTGEIAGHLHPVARVSTRGRALRRRCFASDGRRLVMPAFGAYAGGLNVRDQAFEPLFPEGFTAHLMGDSGTYAFPRAACLPD